MGNDGPKRPKEAGRPRREGAESVEHPEPRAVPGPRRPLGAEPDPPVDPGEDTGRRSARRALLVAGLAGGAVAGLAVARRLGRDTPPLYRSLPTAPLEFPFRNHRVVWYVGGREGAAPVVLIHGIHTAASAWEMRGLFSRLGEDHRVYAYDLLGFGASERPEIDYDAELYVDLLRELLRREVRRPAHVVASSLSAAHAIALAAEEPDAFASLTVINPTGLLTQAEGQRTRGRIVEALLRAPWVGEAFYNLLVSRPLLRLWRGRLPRLAAPVAGDESSTEQSYTTAHQPGARFAQAAFLGDALACNTFVALRAVQAPLLAVWGEDAASLGTAGIEEEQAAFAGVAPRSEHAWVQAGAFPHEEMPDEVSGLVREWVERAR